MRLSTKITIALLILVFTTAMGATAVNVPYSIQNRGKFQRHIPIVVKQTLWGDNGYHVQIFCDDAILSAPGELQGFTCRIRNTSSKNIIAANVTYSVLLEENGKEWEDSRLHTFDTVVHPDFYDVTKSFSPGAERIVAPPGPCSYGNANIRGIELKIDYLQFEDKSSLGENDRAAQIIADIREGAVRYKEWLSKKYIDRGRSAEAIDQFLETNQPLPNEFKDTRLDQGARIYRSRLRQIRETRGHDQVKMYLEK